MTEKAPASPPPVASGMMSIDQAIATAYQHWNAGQIQQAEMLCQKVLQQWPGHADALHLMGLMAHNWNNLDLAIDYLRRATQSPRAPALYFSNLAEMLRQKGNLSEGEQAGRQAVTLEPTLSGAWNNLGIILQEQGNLEEALICLQRVIALKPDYAEAFNNLGNTFKRMGRLAEAQGAYTRALNINPSYAQAYSNLSNLLKDLGAHDQAAEAVKKAIELDPRAMDAYVNAAANETARLRHEEALRWLNALLSFAPDNALGLAAKAHSLSKLDMNDEALEFARRATIAAPQSGDAWNAYGQVLQALNRSDEALAAYTKAEPLSSSVREQAFLNRGTLLMEINRSDEALEAFAAARNLNPHSTPAYFNAVDLKTYKDGDPEITAMEQLLKTTQGFADRTALHFGLAKMYMDAGESEKSFAHLNEGNRLKRSQIQYSSAQTEGWMASIAAQYTAENVKPAEGASDSELPVFIVGLPRSGTTLVEQILASHPAVHGAGELAALQKIVTGLRKRDGSVIAFPNETATLPPQDKALIGQAYMMRAQKLAEGKARMVDKMPANFLYAGVIASSLPKARIIHIKRNAVDTCLSCYTKLFAAEQNFSYDLKELGEFYKSYDALMAHWRSILPANRFIDVDYEAVVADVEKEARRLIAFLGLPWEAACLDYAANNRPIRTASLNQVRKPIYNKSVGRWKKFEAHLGPLIEALGPIAKA